MTSDGGLLAYRDLDDASGLFDSVSIVFSDIRTGHNIQHDMPTLLRQSIYSRLTGYKDVNDAKQICHVSDGRGDDRQEVVCWGIVSDWTIAMLFCLIHYFLIWIDGYVSLTCEFRRRVVIIQKKKTFLIGKVLVWNKEKGYFLFHKYKRV